MVIQHNMTAAFTNRQLGITRKDEAKRSERLASGYRINRAGDDAAGLSISEKLRTQIRGLDKASNNIQDGISVCQIADGALQEVHNILQRIRQLAVQASNDTNCAEDREAIDEEVQNLKLETDRIFDQTEYNTLKILKGSEHIIEEGATTTYTQIVHDYEVVSAAFPPGAVLDPASAADGHLNDTYNNNGVILPAAARIDFSGVDFSDISALDGTGFYSTCCTCTDQYCFTFDSTKSTSSQTGTDHKSYIVGTQGITNASQLVQAIIDAGDHGHPNNHYTWYKVDPDDPTNQTLLIHDERNNVTAGGDFGTIKPGVIKEIEKTITGEIISDPVTEYKTELWIQMGANTMQGMYLKGRGLSNETIEIDKVNTLTYEDSQVTIMAMDYAIGIISEERTSWGTKQNRLEAAMNIDDNTGENLQYAESRIRDADMADEMTAFSKHKILEEAGTSMLTQANQLTQGVLSLLK